MLPTAKFLMESSKLLKKSVNNEYTFCVFLSFSMEDIIFSYYILPT